MHQTITTTRGELPADALAITEGVDETPEVECAWREYRYEGELVRRDLHVRIKAGEHLSGLSATF